MKPLGVLDRYVLRHWLTTFLLSGLGIPAVAVLIRLADEFGGLSRKGVPVRNILLGELYFYPSQVAMLLPAAVLFATVFTLNALGRRSELTAAKAGGISFFRLIAPMLTLAALAVPINFGVQELSAATSVRRAELHGTRERESTGSRFNFAYASTGGWTVTAKQIDPGQGTIRDVVLVPPDSGAWTVAADSGRWDTLAGRWTLYRGTMYRLEDSATTTVRFRSLVTSALPDTPAQLAAEARKSEEMRISEFQDHLRRMAASGTRPGMLAVDYHLKFALPVACLIVALFGAPLAVTNPRAGAALGLAMALGSTLVYLTGTQIMKAVGGRELLPYATAAWSMNALFLLFAVVLLTRVRS